MEKQQPCFDIVYRAHFWFRGDVNEDQAKESERIVGKVAKERKKERERNVQRSEFTKNGETFCSRSLVAAFFDCAIYLFATICLHWNAEPH